MNDELRVLVAYLCGGITLYMAQVIIREVREIIEIRRDICDLKKKQRRTNEKNSP